MNPDPDTRSVEASVVLRRRARRACGAVAAAAVITVLGARAGSVAQDGRATVSRLVATGTAPAGASPGAAVGAMTTAVSARVGLADVEGPLVRAVFTRTSTNVGTPPLAIGAPAVAGAAVVGHVLTASPGEWVPATSISFAYQWGRCDSGGGDCKPIAGAHSSAYTATTLDNGSSLRVLVVASASGGARAALSPATAVVGAPSPTSASGMLIGLNGYPSGSPQERARILQSGVKLIRSDRGDYGVTWAHSQGITVDGIIWMDESSPGLAADVVELDNEPYFNNWNGLGGIAQWAMRARDLAKSIKALYPGKRVLLPTLAVTNNGDILDGGSWTPMLYAVNEAAPDIWKYVDGLAIHPYTQSNGPSAVFSSLDHLRTELTTIGSDAARLPFWVTEAGWTNTGAHAVTEPAAAEYMQELIAGLKARTDVSSLIIYTTSDNPYASPLSEQGYGVFHSDGTAKPVLAVLVAAL